MYSYIMVSPSSVWRTRSNILVVSSFIVCKINDVYIFAYRCECWILQWGGSDSQTLWMIGLVANVTKAHVTIVFNLLLNLNWWLCQPNYMIRKRHDVASTSTWIYISLDINHSFSCTKTLYFLVERKTYTYVFNWF